MSARLRPSASRFALSRVPVRGVLAALLLGAAPAAAGGSEAVMQVSAQVVSSARLRVPEATPASLRTVEVPGGHYLVLALDAQVLRHGAPAGQGLTLSWRAGEGEEPSLPVRFHPGVGGAWSRPGFGVALSADAAPVALSGARGGGELAVFVPQQGPGGARGFVVLTVMADGAP